jgi:hypothetical protein
VGDVDDPLGLVERSLRCSGHLPAQEGELRPRDWLVDCRGQRHTNSMGPIYSDDGRLKQKRHESANRYVQRTTHQLNPPSARIGTFGAIGASDVIPTSGCHHRLE